MTPLSERTLSKWELIDSILEYNTTAAPDFLALFPERELQNYLGRVSAVSPRRARHWQRQRRVAPADLVRTVSVRDVTPAAIAPVPQPGPRETDEPVKIRRPEARYEGRAPVATAMQFLRSRRWPIPAGMIGLQG